MTPSWPSFSSLSGTGVAWARSPWVTAPWRCLERAGSTKTSSWPRSGITACSASASTGSGFYHYWLDRDLFTIKTIKTSTTFKFLSFHLKAFITVSRLRDKVVTTMTETAKRYVITNPSFDFGLLPTDQVSVLPPQLKKKYESVQLQNINNYFISTQKTNLLCDLPLTRWYCLCGISVLLFSSMKKVPYLFPEGIKSDSILKSSA